VGQTVRYWREADNRGGTMAGTYKMLQLVGTSEKSFAEAVKVAVAEASKTVRHMDWFEVVEERGRIEDGKVVEFQVKIQIGFKVER
jgi:flavin-binding protein dodecin